MRYSLRKLGQARMDQTVDIDLSRGFTVRVTTPEDELAVSTLLQASYPTLMRQGYDNGMLAAVLPGMTHANPLLLRSGTYYLAETKAGLVVGCGGWTRERPGNGDVDHEVAHIRHFATHPEWIGLGVGRSIYAVCEREAQSAGVIWLECYSSLNAEGFYAALGFAAVQRVDIPFGSDLTLPTVLMRRAI